MQTKEQVKTGTNRYQQRFEALLQEFLHSPEVKTLNIGKVRETEFLHQFERHFSIQRVYAVKGEAGKQRIYVKLYKNAYKRSEADFLASIQRDYDTNRFWYDKLAPFADFSTFKPLYLSLEHRGMITEEAEGENLGVLVRTQLKFRPSRETLLLLTEYMMRAGQLLRTIQKFPVEPVQFDLETLIEDIDSRMREFVSNPESNFTLEMRQAILQFFREQLPAVRKLPLHIGYLHRDFMMGNLLVSGNKLIVHDFSRITVGPGLHDLTRFYHHLELLKYKPIYRNGHVRKLQEAFLQGYGYAAGPAHPLFRFFLLRHYITHYKGLVKAGNVPLKSKLYNRWVMRRHLENIRELIHA
ncbi:MAG: phosphotransferase [candidate division KSB1 bacterium]|nr:phosphotransferase [candidate division KSB1 bacterium]